jgi:hypothetical protein
MKFLETSEEIQGNFKKPETSHRYPRHTYILRPAYHRRPSKKMINRNFATVSTRMHATMTD